MIGLFFELTPRLGHEQAYFDIAAGLRPQLEKNPGLMFIDRFKSLIRPRVVLSHSHWRDEASLAGWRSNAKHHAAQTAGRQQHFEDYRLRIAQLAFEWHPTSGVRRMETSRAYNDPELRPDRFLIAGTSSSPIEAEAGDDVFVSVYREREYIVLRPAPSFADGAVLFYRLAQAGTMTAARLFLISRDYGMHERTEAPQYHPPVREQL